MSEMIDLERTRSAAMAFRLEIADFAAFYERTYDLAYRTALGIVREPALAADVTQEAYIAAYRDRGRFRGDAPPGAWLHRIVVNKALSAARRGPATSSVIDLHPPAVPDHASNTSGRLALLDALDELPVRHRAAVVLRYYHDYDYAAIARILETTSTNVGAMLSRALDRLKVALEGDLAATDKRGRNR
jgi:RNA polymerase sigma-70 factor (ECF subfamily)